MDRLTSRTTETLPFFVTHPSQNRASSFRIFRWWRSLPRLKRSFFGAVFLLIFVCSLYAALSYEFVTVKATLSKNTEALLPSSYSEKQKIEPEKSVPKTPSPVQPVAITDRNTEKLEVIGHRQQVQQPRFPQFSGPQNEKQKMVVEAFQHAWKGYKKFAWGKDQLRPISKTFQQWFGTGLTIVDSLDTIIIMGLHQEFEEAKLWVENELSLEQNNYVSLFEATIRMLGGLLSAYHLSGEAVFLEKATNLGQRLLGAFDSPSPVPYSDVHLKNRKGKMPVWSGDSSLAEIATIQLEFRDLSRVTGNPIFERIAFNVSEHLHKLGCNDFEGLCPMFISPKTGKWKQGVGSITFGARADSYYEYLLKQWLQTGKTLDWLLKDYNDAISSMQKRLLRYSEPNKLTFVGEIVQDKSFSPKMDHLVCYLAGTLALGASNGLSIEHMEMGKQLAETCHEMYRNPTGLGPEIAHFNMLPGQQNDLYIKPLDAHCLLRPEAIEAWFYLYRLTGDQKYVDWGWEAFQAMEKYARVGNGYSSVSNVKKVPVTHKDLMESFFLAETLKYLYLLFADDQTIIPLNEYVFNTEAHPLPIYQS